MILNDGFLAPPIPSSPASSYSSSLGGSPHTQPTSTQSFLHKLFKMVSDNSTDNVIRWTENGDSFIVFDTTECEKILPLYYKHRQFSSFVRQLNMYGFHKINKAQRTTPTTSEECARKDFIFSNPYFQQDRPDLLDEIRRKQTDNRTNTPTPNINLNCPPSPNFSCLDIDQFDPTTNTMLNPTNHQLFPQPSSNISHQLYNNSSTFSSPADILLKTFPTFPTTHQPPISPQPLGQNAFNTTKESGSNATDHHHSDSHTQCRALFVHMNRQLVDLANQLHEQRQVSQSHHKALVFISEWLKNHVPQPSLSNQTVTQPQQPSLQVTDPAGELVLHHDNTLQVTNPTYETKDLKSNLSHSPTHKSSTLSIQSLKQEVLSPTRAQFKRQVPGKNNNMTLTIPNTNNLLVHHPQQISPSIIMSGMAGLDVSASNVSPLTPNDLFAQQQQMKPGSTRMNQQPPPQFSDTSTCAMQYQHPNGRGFNQPSTTTLFQASQSDLLFQQQLLFGSTSSSSNGGQLAAAAADGGSNAFDAFIQKQMFPSSNINSSFGNVNIG